MTNPREPTDHVPGSPGKVEVIIARYEAGVPMWLPGDRPDYVGMYPDVAEQEQEDEFA